MRSRRVTADERGEAAGSRATPTLAEKVRALTSGAATGDAPSAIRTIETHFAWVFIGPHFAFKLKKPLPMGDFDLRSLDARARICDSEVRLNRRLAPDVYLGVEPLTRDEAGRLHVGGAGVVFDWLVKMRALPADLMLDRAAVAGTVDAPRVHALGRCLSDFYRAQRPEPFATNEYVERLRARIAGEARELIVPSLELPVSTLGALMQEQMLAVESLQRELNERASSGRIVEAHGDLRPEHVCLSTPPVVIDSLEFSRELRILDPLEELAFFDIECAALGLQWVSQTVMDVYRTRTQDSFRDPLLDLYRSLRATARAKVVAWHLLDPHVRANAPWKQRAERYLDLALRTARTARG